MKIAFTPGRGSVVRSEAFVDLSLLLARVLALLCVYSLLGFLFHLSFIPGFDSYIT